MPTRPDQHLVPIAPGIYRLGDRMVNYYLVLDDDGITLVDAGLPTHHGQLTEALAHLGRGIGEVRAVLITHGHLDHIGMAERVRVDSGATVYVHAADAPTLANPRQAFGMSKPERSLFSYALRRPAALAAPLHLARAGSFRTPPVQRTDAVDVGRRMAVPGAPLVVAVPGHTRGSVAYVLPERGVVFTGDVLVTRDGLTGRTGPRVVARGFTHDSGAALASLTALAEHQVPLVLPGHGEPYANGLPAAVAEARRAVVP
jgi:glyoxylase-like metal-dependent hydrolase (beta-lactamase superfamily II)